MLKNEIDYRLMECVVSPVCGITMLWKLTMEQLQSWAKIIDYQETFLDWKTE